MCDIQVFFQVDHSMVTYNYGFTFYRVDFIFASIHRNKLGNATRMD